MKIKIKICGISDHLSMTTLSNLNVDYVGLVFFEQSPRNISIEKSKLITRNLNNSTKLINTGFVTKYGIDNAIEEIIEAYKNNKLIENEQCYTVKWMKKLDI